MSIPRDNQWFLEQVRQEQGRLRAYIRVLGVRAEAVDDVAQDALIVAFEKRETFGRDGQNDFGAWVRGISRKLVANTLRKEMRRRQLLSDGFTDLLLLAEDTQLHPLAGGENHERLSALSDCVNRLPSPSRELVALRYFEELTPGAIGSRLDRTANDVRQLLFRIRKTLLSCVERRLAAAAAQP
jgi:RNA polymerase sigma-70 factor, ECF subfamily